MLLSFINVFCYRRSVNSIIEYIFFVSLYRYFFGFPCLSYIWFFKNKQGISYTPDVSVSGSSPLRLQNIVDVVLQMFENCFDVLFSYNSWRSGCHPLYAWQYYCAFDVIFIIYACYCGRLYFFFFLCFSNSLIDVLKQASVVLLSEFFFVYMFIICYSNYPCGHCVKYSRF